MSIESYAKDSREVRTERKEEGAAGSTFHLVTKLTTPPSVVERVAHTASVAGL